MFKKKNLLLSILLAFLLSFCKQATELPVATTPAAGPSGPEIILTEIPEGTATTTPQSAVDPAAAAPTAVLPSLTVVYIKDGDLWSWSRRETRRLTASGGAYELRFAPDGGAVAYTRRIDNLHLEIWVVDLVSGEERRLIGIEALDAIAEDIRDPNAAAVIPLQFEWVPDRRLLAFNTAQIFDGPGISPLDDLQMVNIDTLDRWALLDPGQGGNFYYSASGRQIAVVTPTDIRLMDANAGDQRNVLAYHQVATYSEYRYYARPVWSPDEAYLLAAVPPTDPLAAPAEPTIIYKLPIDGSLGYQVGAVFSVPFFDTPVEFSPDLQHLIYLHETGHPNENRRELRTARPDGSDERVYTNGVQMRFMGWGADSYHFAYFLAEDQSTAEGPRLWIGSLDNPAGLFTPAPYQVYKLRWIDDRHFLTLSEQGGSFGLYLASLGGENTLIDILPDFPPAFDFSNP